MRRVFAFGVVLIPFAAAAASASVVFDGTGSINDAFVTGISSIYFDDASTTVTGSYQINQLNFTYENLAKTTSKFDLLVQFYNTVDYAAGRGVPVGTDPIGGLIDVTGLSAAADDVGQTGLIPLKSNFPIATSGTIGYEFEFVTPGTTSFSESNINESLLPVFRIANPTVGSTNPFFGYDVLGQNSIVGDTSSGDVFTFPNVATLDAQIGAIGAAALNVTSGQRYVIDAPTVPGVSVNSVAGVTIARGATLVVSPVTNQSNRQVLVVTSPGLAIAGDVGSWTGLLDLNNNDLILPGASLATVTDQVKQGFNNGSWNANGGITSSSAASDHLMTLGVIQNDQSGSALFTKFDGYPVGASDVLVKSTYFGDANLDGVVDGSDYSRIDNGFLQHGNVSGWFNGDFNYDGVIDGSDYTLIDNAFNTQGASLATAFAGGDAGASAQVAGGSVPEPAALSLLGVGAIGTLSRRRRSTKR